MVDMDFNIGDLVRLKDDVGQGVITSIHADQLWVEINGIEIPLQRNELVKVTHDQLITRFDAIDKISHKDRLVGHTAREKLNKLSTPQEAVYELDLHIHELLDRHNHMSNGEILQYQMNCCRRFMMEAIERRYRKVILIHGVGEGVLKLEIHRYLDQLQKVEYHDAPYRTYGYGATEVIIRT